MASRVLLSVVGMPCSGKSTVAQIMRKKFNACIFSTGDIIREEIKRRGLKYTQENDRVVSKWFHSGREAQLIGRLCAKIKKCRNKIIVIEGLRVQSEPKLIEKCLDAKPIIITVNATFAIRHKRELARKRFGKETEKYLRERDARELKYGLGSLIKNAHYKIINNGSLKVLEAKTVKIINKILKQTQWHW